MVERIPGGGKTAGGLNTGRASVEWRQPDHFIIDSFTYEKFLSPIVCENYEEECSFFVYLLEGNSPYELTGSFSYNLPNYIPIGSVDFLNPEIWIFQRK